MYPLRDKYKVPSCLLLQHPFDTLLVKLVQGRPTAVAAVINSPQGGWEKYSMYLLEWDVVQIYLHLRSIRPNAGNSYQDNSIDI